MENADILALADYGTFQGKLLCASLQQTHISWILLSGKQVFKIKKPVKLSFLDFSTIQARKLACEREIELNRRFSPIYKGVVPITKNDGSFCIGGTEGMVVDYAVLMRRLAPERKMDTMLAAGNVESAHIVALAELITSFHRRAQVLSSPFGLDEMVATFADISTVSGFVQQNLGNEYGKMIEDAMVVSRQFLASYLPRMNERVRLGFRRDVHGDLHAGNIFLYKRPLLFDCIEYNDRFRQIDVIDEMAFLCMDLEAFGQSSLSEMLLSLYCDNFPCFQTETDNMIFIYYKFLRASIRAKVLAVTAMTTPDDITRENALGSCKKYLCLLNSYTGQLAVI